MHGSNPLTSRNTTENNCTCIISHAQSTTASPHNEFLSGIHWLVVTKKKVSAFSSATSFQGQLQTPQSVSVLLQYKRSQTGKCRLSPAQLPFKVNYKLLSQYQYCYNKKGHKHESIGFLRLNFLSRSTTNSSVSISTAKINQ